MHRVRDLTRREMMIRGSMMAAGAVSLVGGCRRTGPAASIQPAPAEAAGSEPAWPIACRDAHLRETGAADSWSALRAIGADGAEVFVKSDLSCEYLYAGEDRFSIADPAAVRDLGRRFADHGLRITAFCLPNRFDERKDDEIAFTLKVAEVAAALDVPAVRIDVVSRAIADEQEFLDFAVGVGRRLVEGSAGSRVRFGVENHGRTTNKPEFLRRLFAGVDSRRFGLTLDTANFYWFGHPLTSLYDIYAEFAPRACHTHAKSICYPESERDQQRTVGWEYGKYCCPVYEGDIDFHKVVTILRGADFTGDLCIENESLGRFPAEQRADILKKEVEHLRRAVAAAR